MTTQFAPPPLGTTTQSFPQLVFEIDSAGAHDTIYVTDTPSVNDITLKIGTTATAAFTPATTVPDQSGASTATGSLLYLDLTPLNLTSEEFGAISPHATGWQIGTFEDDQLIGMSPDADLTLDPGDTIEISIGALADAQASGASASLKVTVYRVGGITLGNLGFPTNFSVSLATPPVGGEALSDDLMVELVTPDVVNSIAGYDPLENQLAFAFYAGTRGRPVTPSAESQFKLNFVYATDASGYGALCTPDEVKPPFGIAKGVNAGQWKITPYLEQESPSWTLQPPTTGPVVSPGAKSTVAILANNLITKFQPGPTVALISYSGFAGYADGVFTLPIEKHAHVSIDALKVRPNPTVLEDGAAQVKVSWKAENAGTMTLAPFDVAVTGKTSYPATITDTTQITLTAEGTVLASAGNIALRNVTARVLPVINSFEAVPRSVYAGDLPRDIDLSWNVNTNEQLQLISSTQQPDPNKYDAVGTVSKQVDGPQMFTLVPLGQSGGPTVERSIIISAFTPQRQSWPVAAGYLAAPPNASFILASDGNSTVVAVDTMVYKPVSGGVPVGAGPAGMAFSADGSVLYVANSGDGTVSVLSVEATGEVPQYRFTTQSTITVGGVPQRVALSPDGTYLYVTADGSTGSGNLIVISTATATVVASLTVGVAPRGVAVMPSGAQIFVANSGSSTVTVVGRSPGGYHSVVDTVTGVSSAHDVAVTPDGGVLLVACPTAGAVMAINAVYPQAPRATLRSGASPQQLALFPGGGYALVTNQGDDTAALLAVGPTPPQCSVVATGIAVGSSPSAVAVTPDAGLALIGTAGAPGLQALTLAEYQTAEELPGIGGQPTDVAVSPDGTTVVGWHDARESFAPGKPSTGLFVYDIASGTVVPQLATTAVVDFLFAPTTSNSAFLVDSTHPAVDIVSTDTWTVSSTIPLTGQTTGRPVALAASADGSTLFVLTVGAAEKCELVIYAAASPSSYSPLGTVTVIAAGSPGSELTLAAAPDGSAAYVTDEASGNLFVVERDGGSYALKGDPVPVGTLPGAAALSPDGSRLYVASSGLTNGSLAVVDTATLAVSTVVLPANSLTSLAGLAVSPDGTRVLATDPVTAGVRIFDAASLRLVQTIPWAAGVEMPNGIAAAPDGSRIFTANTNSANLGIVAQVQAGAASVAAPPPVVAADVEAGVEADFVGDGTYQGLFIRDYVGQTPQSGNQTGSWTDCPDIWPSGQSALPDPQTTLVGGYGNDSPNTIYTSGAGVNNYVYVRGVNATNGANTSRVWLYYVNGGGAASLLLWPPSWLSTGIQALQTGKPYVEVPSSALNEIDYTGTPFLWDAVPVTGHYCMVAWVEYPPLSEPAVDPRAGIGSIGTYDQLGAFIMNHPNMGWKNTVDQPTQTGESWELVLPFQGPPRGGLFKAGLQFTNMPTDASFSFSIVGPTITPARTIPPSANVPKTQITAPDETFLVPLDWTGANNYNTQMVVTYYAGNTPMGQGANVAAAAAAGVTGLVGLVDDPLAGAIRARVYPTHAKEDGFQEEWLTIIGQVQVNALPS